MSGENGFERLGAALLGLAILAVGGARGQQPTGTDEMIRAWEARQARVKAARFVWAEEVTETKGSISKSLPPWVKTTSAIPPQDHTFTKQRKLTFDGDRVATELTSSQWNVPKQAFVSQTEIATFDGQRGKMLNPPGHQDHPTGQIRREDHHVHQTVMHLRPILMAYRATDQKTGPYQGGPYRLTGLRPMIQGRPCLEVRVMSNAGDKQLLWVDPAQDYHAVRFELRTREGAVLWRADVEYKKHSSGELVPSSWTIINHNPDGALNFSARATVSEVEINPACSRDEFDLKFPEGTYVIDETTHQHFIQKSEGRVRALSNEELSVPYDQLVDLPATPRWHRLRSWPVIAGGVALLMAGIVLAWRWAKQRAARAK